ncbi:MAG: phenylalanine--tRNA ligase subunit beta, partial [Elusimicrobia bacterium]|nr:phenylalanine--tRNA ligase subunit beta [Elusimicrobiota bacterium]MBD3411693.1 phenylalanine--tRNA ligase subunit beta [Elusimicrobiota bacterium]
MKISLQWINEILKSSFTGDDIVPVLEMLGFEIAAVDVQTARFENIVVGEVSAVQKHPRADRLSLATVWDGAASYTVVCGAPNLREKMKVAFARTGARLPDHTLIKKATIRGVDSFGMLCSEKELSLSDDAAGIMHLPDAAVPGEDFARAYGLNDTMIEFEVTPNRPDVLSHIGIAREIAAAKRIPCIAPKIKSLKSMAREISVTIHDDTACARYIGHVVNDIRVGPSPHAIRQRLATCGIRTINNVVDITNYVLLETGQPLHAFDCDRIQGQCIQVRFGRNEHIRALDGKEYPVDGLLVIADAEKPVAIAGVMGG